MRHATIDALKRLSKGKFALSPNELVSLRHDLARATDDDVLAAVAKKAKRAAPEKPAWLYDIEATRKRVKWSAAEAARALVQVAVDDGLIPPGTFREAAKPPGFAVAARKIGKLSDGARLARVFAGEVQRIEREYALG